MRWMQVAIQPAKPFAFGARRRRARPVFGLPGNPVSSLVSFELFARPALRQMMGHADSSTGPASPPSPTTASAAGPTARSTSSGSSASSAPTAGATSRSAGGQGSHQLAATAAANALAVLPDGDGVAAGGDVDVLLLTVTDARRDRCRVACSR